MGARTIWHGRWAPSCCQLRARFSGANTNFTVSIGTFNPTEPTRETLQGFVEADGYVSIEAEHDTKKTDAGANRWIRILNHGHTLSGKRVDGPPETLAWPGKDSPSLEFRMYLFKTSKVGVEAMVGPPESFHRFSKPS